MYKGEVGKGLGWLFAIVIGYVAWIIPGLLLHLVCVFNAASGSGNPGAAKTELSFSCPHCQKTIYHRTSQCPWCLTYITSSQLERALTGSDLTGGRS
jgi:hypothetical protein